MKEVMSGAQGKINAAQGSINTGRQAKTKVNVGGVGSEKPVSPAVVQEGGSMAEAKGTSLRGATEHLRSEHPIDYHDHGPHHGTSHHIRHHPVTSGVYGRPKG